MQVGLRARLWAALLLILTGLMAGCAQFPLLMPGAVLPTLRQSQTDAEQLRQYEQKRDEALFQAAQSRLEQGDERGCRMLVDQLLDRTPEHLAGRLLLADLQLLQEDFQAAQTALQAILAESPDCAAALHALGIALAAQGDHAAASGYFAQAAQAEPDNELYALSHRHSDETSGKQSPASAVQPVSSRQPSQPPTSSRRRVQVVSDTDSSVDSTSPTASTARLASAAQGSAAARALTVAAAALYSQEIDKAQRAFEEAMRLEPESTEIPLQASLAALQDRQPELALRLLNPAVTRHPNSLALRRLQGLILYRQGEYAAARTALETALAIDRHDALSHFILGHTLERLNQPEAAAEQFAHAGQLDPALLEQ